MSATERQKPVISPYTVQELMPLTPASFSLRLARASGSPLTYRAGQFAMVTVLDKETGEKHTKALSFSSTPQDADTLEFGFERRGLFTQALTKLQPGDTVHLRAPLGFFTVPDAEQGPLVFLAGGTGISPVIGMLRDLAITGRTNPAHLIYSSRTVAGILFRKELDALAAVHPGFQLQYTITQEDPEPGMLRGRFSEALLTANVATPAEPLYFLCGPPDMVQDLIRICLSLGVDRERILTEQYD